MPTVHVSKPLLSSLHELPVDTIAVHTATIEEVTYGNVLKTGASQAGGYAKVKTNGLLSFFGVKPVFSDKPVQSLAQIVIERSKYWRERGTSSSVQKMVEMLGSHLGVSPTDLELLSVRLIEQAGEGLGLSEDLLLSQKAELIAEEFLKDCVRGVQEALRKQGDAESVLTQELIARTIAEMSPAERLEIQKALGIGELTGKTLRDVFMRSGLPMAGIVGVQAGGFGAYLALTSVMHAVFTSLLGVTLPFAAYTTAASTLSVLTGPVGIALSLGVASLGYFWGQRKLQRSQYAMVVFACVSHRGSPLVPATASLPSVAQYKLLGDGAFDLTQSPATETSDFAALVLDRKLSSDAAADLHISERELEKAERERTYAQAHADRLNEKLSAMSLKILEDSALKAAMERALSEARYSALSSTQDLERLSGEIGQLKGKVAKLEARAEEAQARHLFRLDKRKSELRQLWGIHYPNFEFGSQPLRWAAEQEFTSRLEIERALTELSLADDPAKQSRSKMHVSGDHHKGFTIPVSVPCRLFYKSEGRRVTVNKMCLRRDAD